MWQSSRATLTDVITGLVPVIPIFRFNFQTATLKFRARTRIPPAHRAR
ncbi:MAG: hypothetical protein ACJAVZ_000317 [Afipia broomeae]|jgi:hypothetical protein